MLLVWQTFLEEEKREGLIQGGKVATESDEIGEIWRLRESISVALNKAGDGSAQTLSGSESRLVNVAFICGLWRLAAFQETQP